MNAQTRTAGSIASFAALMIFGLLAVTAPDDAHAAYQCVANVTDFYSALDTAAAQPADQPFQIKLVQGTYYFGSYRSVPTSPFSLLGGYAPGCGSKVVDAENTIVDFGGTGFLTIAETDASPHASVTVEGITFQHGEHVALEAGQAQQIFDHIGSVTVHDVRFTDFTASDGAYWDTGVPVSLDVIKGTLTLQNVVFDHLHQQPGHVGCAVDASLTDSGAVANFNFVSADLVDGNAFCMDPDPDGQDSQFTVYNSIFWNSDNLQGPYSTLQFLDFSQYGGVPPTVSLFANTIYGRDGPGIFTESGTLNANPGAAPLWENPVAGVAGNYRLLPTSASINTGVASGPNGAGDVPATDISGYTRVIGKAPDRGAYESSFVDNPSTVVTTTADSGVGSLRAALAAANYGADVNTITFALPSCPAIIQLQSPLIVNNPVIIDGYANNPAAKYNDDASAFNATLCVIIEEAVPNSVLSAFTSNSSLTLRGIAFGGFVDALQLGGSDSTITGNQFGGTVGGVSLAAAKNAIWVKNLPSGDITIGGLTPGERNVISGATYDGILIDSSVTTTQCHVQGNLIGLAPDGLGEVPNEDGIEIRGNNCVVTGNWIAANFLDGIWINGGKWNTIQANNFGFNVWGNSTASYGWAVRIDGTGNVIGSPNNAGYLPSLGNIISFMDTGGILVNNYNNSVRGNLSDFNGYQKDGSAPDVQLTANGNFQQPFPTITKVALPNGLPLSGAKPATVSGHLASAANAFYRVDVYYSGKCSPSGRGHADYYLASQQVKTDATGKVDFDVAVTLPFSAATSVLSLGVTDAYANSSEIGTCFSIDRIFKDGADEL